MMFGFGTEIRATPIMVVPSAGQTPPPPTLRSARLSPGGRLTKAQVKSPMTSFPKQKGLLPLVFAVVALSSAAQAQLVQPPQASPAANPAKQWANDVWRSALAKDQQQLDRIFEDGPSD